MRVTEFTIHLYIVMALKFSPASKYFHRQKIVGGTMVKTFSRSYELHHEKTVFFLHMRKNKDADQLCGNREADQRLCFCYMDSTILLFFKPLAIFYGCTARFCVGSGQKPLRPVFSHQGSYKGAFGNFFSISSPLNVVATH